jgi:Tfp pilus assembly protein PilV
MNFLNKNRSGDTLIEVMLAFAILSAVIGTAFGGAMSSYRSGITAQNRTQALFLAQYQADGLKTYRDSLEWNSDGGLPSFLNGKTSTLGDNNLTAIKDATTGSYLRDFCMVTADSTSPVTTYWKINTDAAACNAYAKTLAPNLINPTISIATSSPASDRVEAIITVSYKAANADITEKVTNSIILIK